MLIIHIMITGYYLLSVIPVYIMLTGYPLEQQAWSSANYYVMIIYGKCRHKLCATLAAM